MADLNIRTFGAVEGTDSTTAIEATAAAARPGDTIRIPRGRWLHRKTLSTALLRITQPNIEVRIDGDLELVPQTYKGQLVQVHAINAPGVRITGSGRINGNMRAMLAGGFTLDEQTHCIQIEGDCAGARVEGVSTIEPWGDGLRLLGGSGTSTAKLRDVRITEFSCRDFNRSGIHFQRRCETVLVERPMIISGDRGGQCIDSEQSNSTGADDGSSHVTVRGGMLVRKVNINGGYPKALTGSGISTVEPARFWIFEGITIDGDVDAVDTDGLTMRDCTINGSPLANVPALYLHKRASFLNLQRVTINKPDGTALKLAYQSGGQPSDASISGLRMFAKNGVLAERCTRILMTDCRAFGDSTGVGFRARAITETFDGFITEDCRVSNFATGLLHDASDQVLRVRSDMRYTTCAVTRRDQGNVVNIP